MFLKKCDIYYSKWATVVQKFQLSMTKLGTHDEIRWFDGTDLHAFFFFEIVLTQPCWDADFVQYFSNFFSQNIILYLIISCR
jgi:hypothetical protein